MENSSVNVARHHINLKLDMLQDDERVDVNRCLDAFSLLQRVTRYRVVLDSIEKHLTVSANGTVQPLGHRWRVSGAWGA